MYIRRSVRERVDILFSKLDIAFLFLMILGIDVEAPSHMKLFFMLSERGLGKRNVFELSRRLCCSDSFLKLISFSRDGSPK